MNEKQTGSTIKFEIADSVNCIVCGKQVYSTEMPYVCHDCWKNGRVGKYISTKTAEIARLRELLKMALDTMQAVKTEIPEPAYYAIVVLLENKWQDTFDAIRIELVQEKI